MTDHNKLLDVFVKNRLFLKAENRFRKMPVIGEGLESDTSLSSPLEGQVPKSVRHCARDPIAPPLSS